MLAHAHIWTVGEEAGSPRKGTLSEVLFLGWTDPGGMES